MKVTASLVLAVSIDCFSSSLRDLLIAPCRLTMSAPSSWPNFPSTSLCQLSYFSVTFDCTFA